MAHLYDLIMDRPTIILHLWNGRWNADRQDLALYSWRGWWRVEARAGRAGTTQPWTRTYRSEAQARQVFDAARARGSDEWRDVTDTYRVDQAGGIKAAGPVDRA